jgi:hypothetical protein
MRREEQCVRSARVQRLGVGCVAAILMSLGGAATSHASTAQFGAEGEGAAQLLAPVGIARDSTTGNTYISDRGNNRIDEFTDEGGFVRAWGWGVKSGSATFQVCEAPGPCVAGIAGGGAGQLTDSSGIAVDNSAGLTEGDVYVEDREAFRIERFSPTGEFILAIGAKVNAASGGNVCLAGEPCQAGQRGSGPNEFEGLGSDGIAVGPTGTVYVGDVGRIHKFSAGGASEGDVVLPQMGAIEAVAVDSSGDLYVQGEPFGVHEFGGSGTELGSRDPEGGQVALAIGPMDELFVSDFGHEHVFEYDASGTQLASLSGHAITGATGGFAFSGASESLYLLQRPPTSVRSLPLPPAGPAVLEDGETATQVLPTSATLNARINPEGSEETRSRFEYGQTVAYGATSAEETLAPGFVDQAVASSLGGLKPDTEYHFRVVVTNVLGQTAFGPDHTFVTLPPVSVESESVLDVNATSAKLVAELNPHGLSTTYHFQYGLAADYEASVPVPDGDAGEGEVASSFTNTVQNLRPESTYHYRVVAENALGIVDGPDQTFETQGAASAALLDGRAWELVSPPNKHGAALEALSEEGAAIEAAEDGSGLAYVATGPPDEHPAGNRSSQFSELLGHRIAAGVWTNQDIATPHSAPAGLFSGASSEYLLFSSDLSASVVEPQGATPLAPQATERTPYRRDSRGDYTPLVSPENVPLGTRFGGEEVLPEQFGSGVSFVTGTGDLSDIVLRSRAALVDGFETAGEYNIYEWSNGRLTPVSVLPDGSSSDEEGGASVGDANSGVRFAVAAGGARVFFSTEVHLYLRDIGRDETVRVDTPEPGVRVSAGTPVFQLASRDGTRVFFSDTARLTSDSTAKPLEPDLYECVIVPKGTAMGCVLKDLSVDERAGEGADLQGTVLGADDSGRFVYFAARGDLAPGAASGACPGRPEESCVNLYVYDTLEGTRRLVAVLSEQDDPDWGVGGSSEDLGELTARVSPNGRYVAFMSDRSLTGFDNRDAQSGALDQEVYLYDYATDKVSCASCNPSGQRPGGEFDRGVFPGLLVDRPLLWGGQWLAGSIPGWTKADRLHALYESRYLSNEGRLFFNSPVPLVAGDTNGTQDVYEYEPTGVGNCVLAPACVSLTSSGSSSEESAFLDASEGGDDVFFLTAAQLSQTDQDQALDVYDAHVCSLAPGCLAKAVEVPPVCTTSDACRAAPAAQPGLFGEPASATFVGAGNSTTAATKVAPKPTRAQQLAAALRACRKKASRPKRIACERSAQRKFGPQRPARRHKRAKRGKK